MVISLCIIGSILLLLVLDRLGIFKTSSRVTDAAESQRLHASRTGSRCWKCGEKYVGLALDCRCTNWGK